VIPIENSFLYVVPLYLKAEGTNFPQLKRVIVATGDKSGDGTIARRSAGLLVWNKQSGTSPGQPSQAGQNERDARILRKRYWIKPGPTPEAQKAMNSLKSLLATPAK